MSQPLVLLHGALGSSEQMHAFADMLQGDFKVHTWDFPGHGGMAVPNAGYAMTELVEALESWLSTTFDVPVILFGYSMGGYAATVLACRRPELISHIITLGTKWSWSPEIVAREVKLLDPNVIQEKVPALVTLLTDRHTPQEWTDILHATRRLLERLGQDPLIGPSDLEGCSVPVDVLWGTEDRMISREESEETARILPNGQFYTLEGQRHPFEQVDINMLREMIRQRLSIT
ncbi:MAG: alpha/beta hydrolase [Saprospiraceae bacterium]|nr:alpha/beta hydrolase [Saprospiraceae bacterium]